MIKRAKPLTIDSNIVNACTKCAFDFGCLKHENHPCLSAVDKCIGKSVYFVDCKQNSCKFRMDFAYSAVCHCPVRQEIYHKYGE